MLVARGNFVDDITHIDNKCPGLCAHGRVWYSMGKYDGVPYIMVVSSVPKERYGVYMGIVNMMIVTP